MPRPSVALASAYLFVQATVTAAWWLVLWYLPAARAPFVVAGWPEGTLLAFWLPDACLLVFGSLAAANGLRRGRPWARPLVWFVAGGVVYATLWCVAALLLTGSGGVPAVAMLACTLAMAWVVRVLP